MIISSVLNNQVKERNSSTKMRRCYLTHHRQTSINKCTVVCKIATRRINIQISNNSVTTIAIITNSKIKFKIINNINNNILTRYRHIQHNLSCKLTRAILKLLCLAKKDTHPRISIVDFIYHNKVQKDNIRSNQSKITQYKE
jgi:hypothetical protein